MIGKIYVVKPESESRFITPDIQAALASHAQSCERISLSFTPAQRSQLLKQVSALQLFYGLKTHMFTLARGEKFPLWHTDTHRLFKLDHGGIQILCQNSS